MSPKHAGKRRSTTAFKAVLFRYPGKGGWTCAPVPARDALPVTRGWGRTPVRATVDGHPWNTSVWRGKDGQTLLPVPRNIRGGKGNGDAVRVELTFQDDDAPGD